MEKNNIISKSAYLIYRQCPKYLWHQVNDRENIPEADLRARFNFKASYFTASLAKKCFPEGMEVSPGKDLQQNNLKTLKLMDLRRPLFGAGLLYKNACFFDGKSFDIYARADVLLPAENGLPGFEECLDECPNENPGNHPDERSNKYPNEPGFLTSNTYPSANVNPAANTAFLQGEPANEDLNILKETTGAKPATDCWDIIEVKITTGVKKVNLYEIAFQRYCYRAAGINIRNCYVMNINTDYTLKGEINPFEFFRITEITAKIEKLKINTENDLQNIAEIISGEYSPQINPGKFCVKPFNCPLKKRCWESVSSKSILFLNSINHKMIKRLSESDIESINDIPLNFHGISEKQKLQIEQTKNGTKYIDKDALSNFLKQISYPVFYLDFETFASPIPLIENTRPYQSIPFQFSLHVLRKPKGLLEHYGFLSDGRSDPRPALLANLKNQFGFAKNHKTFKGTVIVYDESFERSILRDLVAFDTGHVNWIFKVSGRIVDLYSPFKNFYYYNSAQKGSASVKKVLPALTEKSYDEMAISNGDMAAISFLEESGLWKEAISGLGQAAYDTKNTTGSNPCQNAFEKTCENKGENEITGRQTDIIRLNLLEYSKLDTEGLYYIMQELEKLII